MKAKKFEQQFDEGVDMTASLDLSKVKRFNVVLDTNIFRKSPSRSDLAFKALERLCKARVCRLCS